MFAVDFSCRFLPISASYLTFYQIMTLFLPHPYKLQIAQPRPWILVVSICLSYIDSNI